MKFIDTPLAGLFVVELEKRNDERGYFARAFCRQVFAEHGIDFYVAQCSTSFNTMAGTLRGMHYQAPPHAEDKFVHCTAGEIFDVAVDVRSGSPTYGKWYGTNLSPENGKALFIPKGFAHGYLTLEDNSSIFYIVSAPYHPESERGLLYSDPVVGIEWPFLEQLIVSEKDRNNPCLA